MTDTGYRKAAVTPSQMKIVAPVKAHTVSSAGQYGCAQPGYPPQTSINHPTSISPSTAELYSMIKDQKAMYDAMMSETVN
jgi:hypothetical protein